ncbi:MAG: hypothetical protein ACXW2U_02245 [Telluria sp.]
MKTAMQGMVAATFAVALLSACAPTKPPVAEAEHTAHAAHAGHAAPAMAAGKMAAGMPPPEMKAMCEQMHTKMMAAKTPEERHAVMHEHMKTMPADAQKRMHEHMKSMSPEQRARMHAKPESMCH